MDTSVTFSSLNHVVHTLSWGGKVIVLDDGALITAEDRAMLQALHSRNPNGVEEHFKTLAKKGSGSMMSSFYVGYGHKSIGDCGFATVFIESVSMLAAKAIQDSQLYNGQECSTRYIDFAHQPFFDPKSLSCKANVITEKLRTLYVDSFPTVVSDLMSRFPKEEKEDEKTYTKAINARAFDILRGFLPAGAVTNVAWTGTLRIFADRLVYLRNHPLKEVREIAAALEEGLSVMYPNSFGHKQYKQTEEFMGSYMSSEYYTTVFVPEFSLLYDGVDARRLLQFKSLYKSRPQKTELPKSLGVCGSARYGMLLDFGSWRDFQRHRSVVQSMPLLTTKLGFESWYLDELPSEFRSKAEMLLREAEDYTEDLDPYEAQYYIPMGYRVPVEFSGDIPALVYISEIRSTNFVHPTLQVKAKMLGKDIVERYGVTVFCEDSEVGRFDIKRGLQDIVQI